MDDVVKPCIRCGLENITLHPLPEWPDHCLRCIDIIQGICAYVDCQSKTPVDLFQDPRCNKESLVCQPCLLRPFPVHGRGETDCEADGCVTPEEVAFFYDLLLTENPKHHVPYWDNRIKNLL